MKCEKLFNYSIIKSHIRAAQNKQSGRMRPAGRQFDMPGLECHEIFELPPTRKHYKIYYFNLICLKNNNQTRFLVICV